MSDILLSFDLESLKLGLLTSQKYWDKPLVIFNTASKCGFTKQLKEFQGLYETGKMIPIAIPTNDFGLQEPGDDYEIYQYCHYNYGVEFPVIKKTNIQHNFFQMFGKPSWNFNKYIFNKKHKFIGKFDSKILPMECLRYV